MSAHWTRYDKWGFSIAWCRDGERFYWHVFHPRFGVRWGREWTGRGAHQAANYAIGDMRQGIDE